jgi:PAS domain S-box-containing protein
MNFFALFSLAASITCLLLGFVVYSLNRRALLNKIFVLASVAAFFYSFTTVMMWQAGTFESAYFWNKMGSVWPFFVVLVVHFALVFTESNWLKNKFTYLALYLPAVLFLLIELTTDWINGPPVLEYWGYNDTASSTIVYAVSTVWSAVLPILAFILCFQFYRMATDETSKRQRKFVSIGFAVPIMAFILTNMILRSVSVKIPNLGILSILIFSHFVGAAVWKHGLFAFDAALAAENIISTIPDSLVLTDMKGTMFKMNKRLLSFLGYSENELMGNSIATLCADRKQCVTVLKKVVEQRVIRNHELVCKTKLGGEKTVLFSGSVVQSKTGRDIGLTCIIHDITDRIEMQERLVKAERFASIGELAGQIGHDLRNPLTGIKSGAYILRKKGNRLTEEERDMVLGSIDNAVEDSNRIVNSLVEYSSDLRLQIDSCTPKMLVHSALSDVKVPDRITIRDYTLDGVELALDKDQITKAFASLIKNAIDATPKEGIVEIQSTLQGSTVEISFTDSGEGIPENLLPKLFSPLVTTKAKGLGMGLAICKRVVDAHGGKIKVESAVGKGSTFTVSLPVKPKLEFVVADNSTRSRSRNALSLCLGRSRNTKLVGKSD